MERTYYTVISRLRTGVQWEIEFGDYVRAVAEQEAKDLRAANQWEREKRLYKVIKSGDTQREIDAAVALEHEQLMAKLRRKSG